MFDVSVQVKSNHELTEIWSNKFEELLGFMDWSSSALEHFKSAVKFGYYDYVVLRIDHEPMHYFSTINIFMHNGEVHMQENN